jgi:hypothetical protein
MDLARPKGQVGWRTNLIITATLLMLLVVVPVIIMTFAFAWKYRASNTKATYTPNWSHSTKIESRCGCSDPDHHRPGLRHLQVHPQAGPVPSAGIRSR